MNYTYFLRCIIITISVLTTVYRIDGYAFGRLFRLGNNVDDYPVSVGSFSSRSSQDRPVLLVNRQTMASSGEDEMPPAFPGSYTKKSQFKSLRKYNGNGSRNCFFTPIQCMIQHDMSKYKKLIDSNIRIGNINS